jgi:predicted nucleic acid-binding protein
VSAAAVVVDASLAIKWVIQETYTAEARRLLKEWQDDGRELLAPTLFFYEITNVLAKRMRQHQLTLEQANDRLHFLVETGPTLLQSSSIHIRALELADDLRFPASYDAHYLALAESRQCEFWTADERLWNSVKGKMNWVRWVGELIETWPR